MKRILLLTSIALASSLISMAQDQLSYLNGEIKKVKIVKVGEEKIEFSYYGESTINEVGRGKISHIIFESGRREEITKVETISGEADWEKVKIIGQEADIDLSALQVAEKGERRHSIPFGTESKIKAKLIEKVKKEAASMGCNYIVVKDVSFTMTPVNTVSANIQFYKFE